MSTVYILSGPPASGKTTVAQRLRAKYPDAIYISSDHFIERYARWCGKTYNDVFQKAIKKAEKRNKRLCKLAKEKGLDVIWDQTNLNMEIRRQRAYIFDGYKQVLYYAPQYSLEELKTRNKARERSPLSSMVMNKMYSFYQMPSKEELELWDEAHSFLELNI